MGKRGRESGSRGKAASNKEQSKPSPRATNVEEEYVAYASDGSDAAKLAQSDQESEEASSDCEIPLGPVTVRGNDDEDRMSDVDVSFEFFDPEPEDSGTLSLLLADYSRETGLDSHALAASIVAQTRVGTTVKITDEPAPVAFISCLNLLRHKSVLTGLLKALEKAGGSLAESVMTSCSSDTTSSSNRMGLILTERVVNLPPILVAKMQEAVFSEIEWATEDEEDEASRESFRFAKFLYVTDAFWKSTSEKASSKSKEPPKRRRKEDPARFTFGRPEDEAWMAAAEDVVSWSISGELPGAEGLVRKRLAMVIPAAKVSDLRAQTRNIVGLTESNPEAQTVLESPEKDKV